MISVKNDMKTEALEYLLNVALNMLDDYEEFDYETVIDE